MKTINAVVKGNTTPRECVLSKEYRNAPPSRPFWLSLSGSKRPKGIKAGVDLLCVWGEWGESTRQKGEWAGPWWVILVPGKSYSSILTNCPGKEEKLLFFACSSPTLTTGQIRIS